MSHEEPQKLQKTWRLVVDQFFDHSLKIAESEGPGVSIFNFLKDEKNGSNCEYFYSLEKEEVWCNLLNSSPDGKLITENYNPDTMLCICVQIPVPDSSDTIGTLRLFDKSTRKEVELVHDDKSENGCDASSSLRHRK